MPLRGCSTAVRAWRFHTIMAMKKLLSLLAIFFALTATPRTSSAAEVSIDLFYRTLEPYGEWVDAADYGYVWHPRDVDENWRPYTDGQWVFTDAGWTWVSDEPYGWAVYHYGRWVRLAEVGWSWVPDVEWGPAWVSWRRGRTHVGWAPLPPEARLRRVQTISSWADSYYDIGPANYSFVEVRNFGAPRLREVVVQPRENITIINQTTNITNITVRNNVVYNGGPEYDVIVRESAQPVRRLRLQRETDLAFSDPASLQETALRTRVEGDSLRIAAPAIQTTTASAIAPARVTRTVARAQVDRGWQTAGDPAQTEKLRAKIKSEAKAPANLPPKETFQPVAASPTTKAAPSPTAAGASPTSAPASAPASEKTSATSSTTAPSTSASSPEKMPAATAPADASATTAAPASTPQPRGKKGAKPNAANAPAASTTTAPATSPDGAAPAATPAGPKSKKGGKGAPSPATSDTAAPPAPVNPATPAPKKQPKGSDTAPTSSPAATSPTSEPPAPRKSPASEKMPAAEKTSPTSAPADAPRKGGKPDRGPAANRTEIPGAERLPEKDKPTPPSAPNPPTRPSRPEPPKAPEPPKHEPAAAQRPPAAAQKAPPAERPAAAAASKPAAPSAPGAPAAPGKPEKGKGEKPEKAGKPDKD